MRRAARIDANHVEMVTALRAIGASVQSIASQSRGVPDLLVGYRGVNYLFEVKDGRKSPSQRRLTKDEEAWHAAWRGEVFIVESVLEALDFLNGKVK